MNHAPIRVLIVDDHPVVRAGLVALIDAQPAVHVVGQACNGQEALALADALNPDVLLCDLRLGPGLDGVEVVRELRRRPQAPEVVILTTYDEDADIVRAVEAGAAGYLLKDADTGAIIAAIQAAVHGEPGYEPALQQRVVNAMRTRHSGLSERELEVLRLVAQGRSNKQIAGELFVGEATVKTHLNHAFTKLEVDNRTAAVARARQAGLL
ncbi:response regulator [Gephyromycinifex aptenodytis]|uniref:response regulator n=1 Tax=Gephyromycinifex aptenodytis TaxID=2716227 RepID=UPI001444FDD2|nr:response regulator transcription factor [Gephyromycinifex aptenodytis]